MSGVLAIDSSTRNAYVAVAVDGRIAAREAVTARGATECFLEVRVSNGAAQSLYRQRGFAVVGRRPRYYSLPTEDALVMRLRIGDFSS